MTKFTFDYNTFSDLHKDAFGFRPRNHRFYSTLTTDEQRQEDWDYTCKCLDAEMERMENAEIQSDLYFEERIESAILSGADDRKTAIRWIFQSDNVSNFDTVYGFGYVQYNYGISEKYRAEITTLLEDEEFIGEL